MNFSHLDPLAGFLIIIKQYLHRKNKQIPPGVALSGLPSLFSVFLWPECTNKKDPALLQDPGYMCGASLILQEDTHSMVSMPVLKKSKN